MKTLQSGVFLLVACVAVFALAVTSAQSTPAPRAVVQDAAPPQANVQSIIEAGARSIDAGTQASLTDTATAHPKPARSTLDIVALPLALFCSVAAVAVSGGGVGAFWILACNQERIAALAQERASAVGACDSVKSSDALAKKV